MTQETESEKKNKKRYRLFVAGLVVSMLLLLGRTILNALYSLYILSILFSSHGFAVLNEAVRNALLAQYTTKYFVFSGTSIVSVAVLLVTWWAIRKILIFLTAQFILPVNLPVDRKKASERLASFISGGHGAAVFVKEGRLIERKQDVEGKQKPVKPGIVLVDLSSAVVLSQDDDTAAWNLMDGQDENFDGLTMQFTVSKEKKNAEPFVDVKGPGLVFTKKGEKIVNVVDLRPQTRGKSIEAYTRDGIKLSTRVSVGFSLSDRPDVIPVGLIDGELRWLDLDKSADGQTMTIKGSFDLDEQDRQDIDDYIENKSRGPFPPEEPDRTNLITPYKFYPNRVFHAAYSKARSATTGEFVPWFDAPLEIAIDIFRNELLSIPYDDLYNGLEFQQRKTDPEPNKPSQSTLNLKKIKDNFARRVKLMGIVHFQFYGRRRGNLTLYEGETLDMKLVSHHPIIELPPTKFNSLRSIGVVIKSAGFGDLQPVNPEIKKKMIDNWKAKWEKEVQFINAEYELEAVRVRNRNRAQIQQEMTYLLAGIFQNSHTDEALALRVFQALESAATNPTSSNDISSKEIVSMLESLHKWLLLERKDVLPPPPPPKPKTTVNE